jgi:hypothetical protein
LGCARRSGAEGELGVSHSTTARAWAEHDVKPWPTETIKFSIDPELDAKVRDVVGLYLHPPEHAIVPCVMVVVSRGWGQGRTTSLPVARPCSMSACAWVIWSRV